MFLDDDSDEVVSNYSEKRQLASMAATIAAGLVNKYRSSSLAAQETNAARLTVARISVVIAQEILKILKDPT